MSRVLPVGQTSHDRAKLLPMLRVAFNLAWQASRRALVAHVLAQILAACLPAVLIQVTSRLVDAVRTSPSLGFKPVLLIVGVQAGLLLLQYGLGTVASLSSQLGQQQTANHVLGLIAERVQVWPFDHRQTTTFNEEVSFLRYNTPYRSYQPVDQLFGAVGSTVTLVSVLLILGRTNWLMAAAILASTLPTLYAANRGARLQFSASVGQAGDTFKGNYFYHLLVSRDHAAEIILHRAQGFLISRWRTHANQALRRAWQALLGQTTVEIPAQILNTATMGAVTLLLGSMVSGGALSVGQFVAGVQGAGSAQSSATSVYRSLSNLMQVSLYIARLDTFLHQPQAGEGGSAATVAATMRPAAPGNAPIGVPVATERPDLVELEHASYWYPGSPFQAVADATVTLPVGSLTVIVGPNGAGKTTLLYLLAGLCQPNTGSRRVAPGEPIELGDIALVGQGFAQFNLTLGENVALGGLGSVGVESRVKEALRTSGAGGLIDRIGLATPLGPEMNDGAGLSRGEWQRVAVARALYRRPRLLLMDEPTASADPTQQGEIRDLLVRLSGTTTIAVVSHDLAIAPVADQVVLMDEGRVVATGTHDALIQSSSVYNRYYTSVVTERLKTEALGA